MARGRTSQTPVAVTPTPYVPPVPASPTNPGSLYNPAATPASGTSWLPSGSFMDTGSSWNPNAFPTYDFAQQVANKVGGSVVTSSVSQGPFEIPDQHLIQIGNESYNPGILAMMKQGGTPDWLIAQILSEEVARANGATNVPTQLQALAQVPGSAPSTTTPSAPQVPTSVSQLIPSGNTTPAGGTTPTTTQPGTQSNSTAPASPGFPNAADNMLAQNANLIGYLEELVKNAGYATDATPAWNSMVEAMNANNQRRYADMQEAFGVSGNRFSSAFGTAAQDYWNQNALNQNSLLGQMQLSSQEAARGRELSGASLLANIGQSGLSQLSSQDFQAEMQRMMQGYQAAMSLFGAGSNAASQLASQGAGAGLQFLQNAVGATQGLFGVENQAALAELQRQLALSQLGLSGGSSLSQLWQSGLGLGAQLGGQQYGTQQSQIDRLYQEWLRTQPGYNPLIPYISGAAGMYPNLFYPQFQPSQLGQILGGIGGIAGAAPDIIQALMKIFGGGG
jgi:hypothetical protein